MKGRIAVALLGLGLLVADSESAHAVSRPGGDLYASTRVKVVSTPQDVANARVQVTEMAGTHDIIAETINDESFAELLGSRASDPQPGSIRPGDLTIPFAVDEEMRRWAQSLVSPGQSTLRRIRLLRQALVDPQHLGFRERPHLTSTATEAFQEREGNCLGFAYLLIGLARQVGVPAFFALVEVDGSVQSIGDLRVAEEHLAVAFGPPGRQMIFDTGGEYEARRLRMQPISDLTAMALYYSNAGAELLLSGDARRAIAPLRIAVALDKSLVAVWVNLGVALRRSGNLNGAEEAYKTALGLEPSAVHAFRNLAALLHLRGRHQEAAAVLAAGETAGRPDPFTYWALAERSLRDGHVERARLLYEAALGVSQQERP